ncbi:MAG TPA: NAD-dependent epimerase/dehydratase family protein [bacterium]|nr:NAD-dependent epimerase/dehydratase family protein [bacterium]HPN31274.1 NAD-dependent epimerase/dehydratase family protein [bacterium]
MKILVTYSNSFPGFFIKKKLKKNFTVLDEELDCENYGLTNKFLKENKPDLIILNVPFAGGIKMNIERPAELMIKNLEVQRNIILSAFQNNIKKLIFIGSSCMYPKTFARKLKEGDLLSGLLEETNTAYSIAKISGWQLCKSLNKQYKTEYITLIPANLYGERDDIDGETAHVIGSLISRFYEAKLKKQNEIIIWGSGKPIRDFLYAEDFAGAINFLIKNNVKCDEINAGSGAGYSIKKLAGLIAGIYNYKGKLIFDKTKPDGMPIKLLDATKIKNMGWSPQYSLESGLKRTINWHIKRLRKNS